MSLTHGNSRVQKINANDEFTIIAGSGEADGSLSPKGIAIDNAGNIYVADRYKIRIQKFTADGQFITKWGTKGIMTGSFIGRYGLAVDQSGNVYVADQVTTASRNSPAMAPL